MEIDQKNCVSQVQANYLVAGRVPHLCGCLRSLVFCHREWNLSVITSGHGKKKNSIFFPVLPNIRKNIDPLVLLRRVL